MTTIAQTLKGEYPEELWIELLYANSIIPNLSSQSFWLNPRTPSASLQWTGSPSLSAHRSGDEIPKTLPSVVPITLQTSLQKLLVNLVSLSDTITLGKPCSLTTASMKILAVSTAVAVLWVGRSIIIFVT